MTRRILQNLQSLWPHFTFAGIATGITAATSSLSFQCSNNERTLAAQTQLDRNDPISAINITTNSDQPADHLIRAEAFKKLAEAADHDLILQDVLKQHSQFESTRAEPSERPRSPTFKINAGIQALWDSKPKEAIALFDQARRDCPSGDTVSANNIGMWIQVATLTQLRQVQQMEPSATIEPSSSSHFFQPINIMRVAIPDPAAMCPQALRKAI
jgi:hypothetical protein